SSKRIRNGVEESNQGVVRVQFKRVRCAGGVVPSRTHQHSHLVGSVLQSLTRSASLDVHGKRLRGAIALLVSRQRHADPVILARAKGAALFLADSNNCVGGTIDAQLLPDGIDSREKMVLDVRSDDGDMGSVFLIGL